MLKPQRTKLCTRCGQSDKKLRSHFCFMHKKHAFHTFDSKSEAQRYNILLLRQKLGLIRSLKIQVTFQLKTCTYRPDFVYFVPSKWWQIWTRGQWVIEDWKNGFISDTFKSKWAEMQSMRKYKKYKFLMSEELLE